jgi:hypothetical protein
VNSREVEDELRGIGRGWDGSGRLERSNATTAEMTAHGRSCRAVYEGTCEGVRGLARRGLCGDAVRQDCSGGIDKERRGPSKRHPGHIHGMPNRWSPREQWHAVHAGLQNDVCLRVLGPQGRVELMDHRKKPSIDGNSHWMITVSICLMDDVVNRKMIRAKGDV